MASYSVVSMLRFSQHDNDDLKSNKVMKNALADA